MKPSKRQNGTVIEEFDYTLPVGSRVVTVPAGTRVIRPRRQVGKERIDQKNWIVHNHLDCVGDELAIKDAGYYFVFVPESNIETWNHEENAELYGGIPVVDFQFG